MDDGSIVDLYLARDETAIAHTSVKYGAALRTLANRILCDEPASEECENDTYLEAWNRIPPHEPRDYLFPFIARIARHLAIDRCRRRDAQKRSALLCELTAELELCLPAKENVEAEVSASELEMVIRRFLSDCTAEQRGIFLRRYWYFDTIPAVAAHFGCTESKVKVTLHRLRERLRAVLEEEGWTI